MTISRWMRRRIPQVGAVILLHFDHAGLFINLRELQQGLRVRPPEGIDALILIPHHKDPALFRQDAEDTVLYQ